MPHRRNSLADKHMIDHSPELIQTLQ